jgi:hypothetical protein
LPYLLDYQCPHFHWKTKGRPHVHDELQDLKSEIKKLREAS